MEDLGERLMQLASFKRRYSAVVLESVAQQFPIIERPQYDAVHDIAQLLTWASILALSRSQEAKDAAFRISQFCLTGTWEAPAKLAAGVVLDSMTNFPAVNLAQTRGLLPDDFSDRLPIPLSLDMIRRAIDNSIMNAGTGEITQLNGFQTRVYERAQKYDRLSVSASTSVGKSFILLRVVEEHHRRHKKSVSVYLVPTRALVQQVQRDLTKRFNESNMTVLVSSVPRLDGAAGEESISFVLTQERFQLLLTEEPDLLVSLVVVDEAHKVSEGYRGILLQQVIEQATNRFPRAQLIFSSPMTENPEIFLDGEDQSRSSALKSEDVTVNQNLLWVSQVKGDSHKWHMDLIRGETTYRVGSFGVVNRLVPDSKRLSMVAYELGKFSGGNLVYVNGPAEAEKISLQLHSAVDDEVSKEDNDALNDLIELVKKTINPHYALATVLTRQVAFHYGNMPLLIKDEIERLFSRGTIKYLVATSTLIEGVNLPAKSIFLRGPTKGLGRPMGAIDFWNLAGRAGRQGIEFQGNVVCIDPDKGNVWKSPPPRVRASFAVKRAIDQLVDDKWESLMKFIELGTPQNFMENQMDFEYAFTYFLGEYLRQNRDPSVFVERLGDRAFKLGRVFDGVLENYPLPTTIIEKNPGVSPISQKALYEHFVSYSGNISDLIPVPPEAENAFNVYVSIVKTIGKYLSGDAEKLALYHAGLVLQWVRGKSLADIISGNIRYWESHPRGNKSRSTASIIRDTMGDIENFARYKFVKYSTCYMDVLSYHLVSSGKSHLMRALPRLNIWLEFGASLDTQVSLMSLGLSRATALALSELTVDSEMDPTACKVWLRRLDLRALDISPIMIREIKSIIDVQ